MAIHPRVIKIFHPNMQMGTLMVVQRQEVRGSPKSSGLLNQSISCCNISLQNKVADESCGWKKKRSNSAASQSSEGHLHNTNITEDLAEWQSIDRTYKRYNIKIFSFSLTSSTSPPQSSKCWGWPCSWCSVTWPLAKKWMLFTASWNEVNK